MEFLNGRRPTSQQTKWNGSKFTSFKISLSRTNWQIVICYTGRSVPDKIPINMLQTTPFEGYAGINIKNAYLNESTSTNLYDTSQPLTTIEQLKALKKPGKKGKAKGSEKHVTMKDPRILHSLTWIDELLSTLKTGNSDSLLRLVTVFRPRSASWHTQQMENDSSCMNKDTDSEVHLYFVYYIFLSMGRIQM